MALKDWNKTIGADEWVREFPTFRVLRILHSPLKDYYHIIARKAWTIQHPLYSKTAKSYYQALKFAKSYMRTH
jgi:hypothetical protein